MSDSDSSPPDGGESPDPRHPTRPLLGMALVLMPVLGVIVVTLAYVVTFGFGVAGRQARGSEITWRFSGCPEARPLLEARLADVGLQADWSDERGGFLVTTQLTGDPAVDAGLPATLTTPGDLEIRAGRTVLGTTDDVTDASVRMDLFMVPYVLLSLDDDAAQRVKENVRADPQGKMTFHVDGEKIGWQSNTNPVSVGKLEVNLEMDGDERARMHAVASWSVVLDHAPLPCRVTFEGEVAPAGGSRGGG